MHSANLLVLLAGAVAAESSVTVINFALPDPTLTFKGSDAERTTYTVACDPALTGFSQAAPATDAKSTSVGASASDSWSSAGDLTLMPITNAPTPTAKALVRRQSHFNGTDACKPHTYVIGSTTYEYHLTQAAVFTLDVNCNWTGELKQADITCTATEAGQIVETAGSTTTTLKAAELTSSSLIQTPAVASATDNANGNATVTSTPNPSNSGGSFTKPTPNSSRSGDSSNATPNPSAPAQSPGLAAARPLPTGAMACLGAAAGLFAAALAL